MYRYPKHMIMCATCRGVLTVLCRGTTFIVDGMLKIVLNKLWLILSPEIMMGTINPCPFL